MEKKITLNDLINENYKERNITHELIKEDLQKIAHKQTKKSSFYDHIPTTELERNLNEVISRNSVCQKRREKNILFEFDRKMHRINKIKSKTYRRMRRKEKAKLKELIEESDKEIVEETSTEKESTSEEESLPRQEISEKEESKESLDEENENHFLEEKKIEVEQCEEKEREIVLPGWGAWGGEGLEITKNKFNTIKEIKEGTKREDIYLKNVIINPNKPILDEKYFSSLPPSVSETIFKKKINSSVSKECNSLRVFNLFVKSKNKKSEEVLEEFCYEPMEE